MKRILFVLALGIIFTSCKKSYCVCTHQNGTVVSTEVHGKKEKEGCGKGYYAGATCTLKEL